MCECQECGSKFEAKTKRARFCSTACRMAFTNRRRDRGAELYDLVMAMRHERERTKDMKLWSLVCDRASAFRESDKTMREGRKSWREVEETLSDLPLGRSEGVGDGR